MTDTVPVVQLSIYDIIVAGWNAMNKKRLGYHQLCDADERDSVSCNYVYEDASFNCVIGAALSYGQARWLDTMLDPSVSSLVNRGYLIIENGDPSEALELAQRLQNAHDECCKHKVSAETRDVCITEFETMLNELYNELPAAVNKG